ncbi:hypothetical protein HAX54_029393, partial [Datura stramonium]|nr:hypothetical protein [Datura stramonium]
QLSFLVLVRVRMSVARRLTRCLPTWHTGICDIPPLAIFMHFPLNSCRASFLLMHHHI